MYVVYVVQDCVCVMFWGLMGELGLTQFQGFACLLSGLTVKPAMQLLSSVSYSETVAH